MDQRLVKFKSPHSVKLLSILFVTAMLAQVGCEDPTVGIITGKVTLDGAPVRDGSIAFFPTSADSYTAGGAIVDGVYSSRVPLGELRVEIRVPKQVGEQKLYNVPDSPKMPILAEALPSRYNNRSELSITVEPGTSQHDFELTSD